MPTQFWWLPARGSPQGGRRFCDRHQPAGSKGTLMATPRAEPAASRTSLQRTGRRLVAGCHHSGHARPPLLRVTKNPGRLDPGRGRGRRPAGPEEPADCSRHSTMRRGARRGACNGSWDHALPAAGAAAHGRWAAQRQQPAILGRCLAATETAEDGHELAPHMRDGRGGGIGRRDATQRGALRFQPRLELRG